jgi:hypothetical protein
MGLTRRELLRYGAAMGIGALLGYSLPRINEIIYAVDKLANIRERRTITQTLKTNTTTTTYCPTNTTVTETGPQTNSTTIQQPQNLEEILFGNSDKQFIPLELIDAETDNNNAYLTVYDPLTNTQLQIALPIQYVSNGNINIGNLLSAVKNYNQNNGTNYKVYLVLGRANINQAILQNGIWYLPAPQIYYNIIISDREWENMYNVLQNLGNGNAMAVMPTSQQGPYPNSLWGWSNQPINGYNNIIILYQNGQQVNSVLNYINLADYILGTPNNSNPSSQGILHVDTIAGIQELGVYENRYPVVGVNNYLGTYIVFIQAQGYQLFSNL